MIDRDNDLDPLFCCRGLLVGANGSAVDHLDLAIVGGTDGIHHPIPNTRLSPSHEAVVTGGARAVALWQVAPRRARPEHPKDAVQYAAVINAWNASRLVGQQRLDHSPLEVGQVVSAHGKPESRLRAHGKPLVGKRRTLATERGRSIAVVEEVHEPPHSSPSANYEQKQCDERDIEGRVVGLARMGQPFASAARLKDHHHHRHADEQEHREGSDHPGKGTAAGKPSPSIAHHQSLFAQSANVNGHSKASIVDPRL